MFCSFQRVLVVAAHPDDDILGCGASLSKLIDQGARVKVLFLGEGTSCRYSQEKINTPLVLDEINNRNEMAKKALRVLGIDEVLFHNVSCGRFDQFPLIELGKMIEKEIAEFEPDCIMTHSVTDTNKDHQISFQATLQATRPVGKVVPFVLSYEILSSTEWKFIESFTPNYFISIEKIHLDKKIKAMQEYTSEMKDYPHPRSSRGILSLAQYRGMQVATEYAEAFNLIRGIN